MSNLIPGNQKHLTLDNRVFIEKCLDQDMSMKDMLFQIDFSSSCNRRCASCNNVNCNRFCNDFVPDAYKRLPRAPFVCNESLKVVHTKTFRNPSKPLLMHQLSKWILYLAKPGVEKSHEYIRYILPKGSSFDKEQGISQHNSLFRRMEFSLHCGI